MIKYEAIMKLKYLNQLHNGKYGVIINMAIKALEQEPKQGYWIEQPNGNMLTCHIYKCSVCGGKRTGETGEWIQIHDCKWKYCPDCGAKMGEVEE